jgi:shikimate kinase / 3-dehydroquinate synthase
MQGTIVLAGPPGAGKSTVGREVAAEVGLDFLDLDRAVEEHSGKSPAAIIRSDGEGKLRRIEAEVLESMRDVGVLALGGGTLTTPRARRAARQLGPVICLEARVETLEDRVKQGAIDRPLLQGDTRTMLQDLLRAREKSYAAVDVRLPAESDARAVARAAIEAADRFWVIDAKVGEKTTRVLVGRDLAQAAKGALAAIDPRRTAIAILDRGVPLAARARYVDALRSFARLELIELAGGEEVKTWSVLGEVLERAIVSGAGRQSAVIGLGGGAVCDLAALAGSLLGRGAPVILVPTTVVAQADAAIGGKCAINLGGRNLVGAFHPAEDVIVDVDLLESLDPEEYRSGLAEVLKIGIIGDEELFEAVVSSPKLDVKTVARAIRHKAAVVARDPFEHGERKVLNLGHTLGHALEAASGFSLRHGDAVAMGMAAIARLSAETGRTTEAERDRVIQGLDQVGLPTRADPELLRRSGAHLTMDKKGDDAQVDLVWIQKVGKVSVEKVSWKETAAALLRSGGGR